MAAKDARIQGYARALFAVAEAEGEIDLVEDELYRFGKTVEREPGLREALTDPALPAERKRALLEDLLGGKASSHTVSLLAFVVDQGRAKDLPGIIHALAEVAAHRGRQALAEVRTAVPLDGERRERLAAALAHATGKEIDVKVLVDRSVIGGVVARVGDQVFDGTIKTKLEMARTQLARMR